MKKIIFSTLLLVILFSPGFMFSSIINKKTAEIVAQNFYFEQTGISQYLIQFESVSVHKIENEPYYYVFNIKDKMGFVIVSAEDTYHPIIAYSNEGNFLSENQPENIIWWMNQYVDQIQYLRDNQNEISEDVKNEWKTYSAPVQEFSSTVKSKAVEPLAGDILWDQGNGWNALCPEDEDGPGGYVWAGCVATAMGIVMKYWNYPIHGSGSHSYYAPGYGTLSANFGEATYFWNNMDNTQPNLFAAHLIYHLGVSVNMSYSPEGSGAYSFNVDNALENYFHFHSNATYVERSSYTTQNWINMLKTQIDAGRPVYYSGRDIDDGGHAFVCSGYTDTDLFHFNFGWSGSNNGYYSVDNVGGFFNDQAAVIDIYPENSNTYPSNPENFNAELNTSVLDDFIVNLTWQAPTGKDITNFIVYRDLDEIAVVNNSTLNYTDNTMDPGNYYYSVAALYSGGSESLTESDNVQGLFYVNFAVHDEIGNLITSNGVNCQVTFNGETHATGFGSTSFNDVAFGGNQLWQASADGYPSSSNVVDVIENGTFNIYLDGYNVSIEMVDHNQLNIYPNPVDDVLYIQFKEQIDYTYEVLDLTGKTIESGTCHSKQYALNTESVPKGFYVLRINTGTEIISSPIIKK